MGVVVELVKCNNPRCMCHFQELVYIGSHSTVRSLYIFCGRNKTNSKRQITGHIKSFRYEVVSRTAKTCSDDGLLKHLKGLCIMGREKKYSFRCFRYKILDCSSCININVTKARRYVYKLVGDQVIKLTFDFSVAGVCQGMISWFLHPCPVACLWNR